MSCSTWSWVRASRGTGDGGKMGGVPTFWQRQLRGRGGTAIQHMELSRPERGRRLWPGSHAGRTGEPPRRPPPGTELRRWAGPGRAWAGTKARPSSVGCPTPSVRGGPPAPLPAGGARGPFAPHPHALGRGAARHLERVRLGRPGGRRRELIPARPTAVSRRSERAGTEAPPRAGRGRAAGKATPPGMWV